MILVESSNKVIHRPKKTNITLEEVLRPIWKLTYYSGILLDWCRPMPNPNSLCKMAQFTCITLFFSLLFSSMIFEFVQLFIIIGSYAANIHTVIPNLIWFTPLLLSLPIYVHCLRERQNFLTFFNDWRVLEKEFMISDVNCSICKSKKVHLMMYATYVCMAIGSLTSIGFDMSVNQEASYLLSTYRNIRETVPFFWIRLFHLTSIYLVLILSSLGDVVPSFVYYHAALAVNYLENDIRTVFAKRNSTDGKCICNISKKIGASYVNRLCVPLQDLETAIRVMWVRFEDINKLVGKANFLLGKFMVYSHLWEVFMITSLIYSVFYNLEDALKTQSTENKPLLAYFFNVIALIFRFTSSILMSSQLHQSVNKLHAVLNYLLGHNWDKMAKEERKLLRSFLTRLQSDQLVASPLGLYYITPTTLLTVFGLVVSYVIVLLQSK